MIDSLLSRTLQPQAELRLIYNKIYMVLLPLPARHEVAKEISIKYLSVCSLRKVLKKLFF